MAAQPLALVVASQQAEQESLVRTAEAEGCRTRSARSSAQALSELSKEVALVLCYYRVGATQGLDLMLRWHAQRPETPFVFVVDVGDAYAAGDVMRAGADGYVREPVDRDELGAWIRKCLQLWRMRGELMRLTLRLNSQFGFEEIVAHSKPMREVVDQARAAAEADSPALILGEPGTGKSLLAETIHRNSVRRASPFVTFDVPALPSRFIERDLFGIAAGSPLEASARRGRYESAADGTFFIEDVADLALVTQSRFLRAWKTAR